MNEFDRPMPPWGKTNAAGVPSHHLAHHSMDVAAVLEGLVSHPLLRRRAEAAAGASLDDPAVAWFGAFAFLHDAGKLSPAFQAKAWPEPRGATRSHLAEGAVWADRLLEGEAALLGGAADPILSALATAGRDAETTWFEALLAHHGRPIGFATVSPPGDPRRVFASSARYDWHAADACMGTSLRAWFPDPVVDPDVLRRPALPHLFAGLLALADWIGSDEDLFPHVLDHDPNYGDRARWRAGMALSAVGVNDAPWPEATPTFEALTTHPAPRGAQAAMSAVPSGARLVVLEAETGSGKTEAALSHFARLRSAGSVDALYFAVPTRAAAGQLFQRIDDAMGRIGGPEAVLAVPGQLRAGRARGYRLPGFEVRWDDGQRHWAAEHATRFLAAPIAVGTVDQALMAGLQVKHAPMRAAALSRSLLVIDEVHASDSYMNAVARPLVEAHLALGGHALLMSATLGSAQRCAWLGTPPPDMEAAIDAPYPAIWHSGADRPIEPGSDAGSKTVRPVLIPTMDPDGAAQRAIRAADAGARVLVIRNTVDHAQRTWAAIVTERPDLCLAVAGGPALHHSRFAAEDRRALDAAVEVAFGKASMTGAVIAVGTQTLEQSLDIDADLLVTDLCPMDVLLQRVGRLHRHAGRRRPTGFERAEVHVLAPEGGLDRLAAGPSFENGLGAWRAGGGYEGIYVDLRVLERTRRLIETDDIWSIPRDNRRLVEGATHAAVLAATEREMGWEDYGMRVDAKGLAEGRAGGLVALDRSAPFPSGFPEIEEAVQTRLGERGPLIALPEGTIGPFGHPISTLVLPAHWSQGITDDDPIDVEREGHDLSVRIGDRTFGYDRGGLRRREKGDA